VEKLEILDCDLSERMEKEIAGYFSNCIRINPNPFDIRTVIGLTLAKIYEGSP
jgi:hypothetical protein